MTTIQPLPLTVAENAAQILPAEDSKETSTMTAHVENTISESEVQESPIEGRLAWLKLSSGDQVEGGDSKPSQPTESSTETTEEATKIDVLPLTEDPVEITPPKESTEPEPEPAAVLVKSDGPKDEEKTAPEAINIDTPHLYTLKDVSTHNSPADMWLVIDNDIYDVTQFRNEHPGGAKILNGVAGKDATKKFDKYHRRGILERYRPKLRVGVLDHGEAGASSRRGLFKKLGVGRK